MNSKNSKISDLHRLLVNLTDKLGLRNDKYIALSNLSLYYRRKIMIKSYKNNRVKISAPTWNEEFELPDGFILYHIFKIILNIYLKTWRNDC